MAQITKPSTGTAVTLGYYNTLGRSPKSTVVLASARTSSIHAAIFWKDGAWNIQDLKSTNGVDVDGARLAASATMTISAGAQLIFGSDDELWQLADAGAPNCAAVHQDGQRIYGSETVLNLPDNADQECRISAEADGWIARFSGKSAVVLDQQLLELRSGIWRLELPAVDEKTRTTEVSEPQWTFDSVTFKFHESRSGDHLTIAIEESWKHEELPGPSYANLLLCLARFRQNDASDEALSERGWMQVSDVLAMEEIADKIVLANLVHRARKAVMACGIEDGRRVIDRRTNEIRFGTDHIRIEQTELYSGGC